MKYTVETVSLQSTANINVFVSLNNAKNSGRVADIVKKRNLQFDVITV